jgi:hypothetical protein
MPPLLIVPGTKITAADLALLNVMFTTGAQDVSGVKTFVAGALPILDEDPASDSQAARKGYIDARNYKVIFPSDDLRAALQGASDGDRFWLQPGDHPITQSIVVTANNVIVHGSREANIAGQVSLGANPVLDIDAANFVLEGPTLSSVNSDLMVVRAGRSAAIRNVLFSGGGIYGLTCSGCYSIFVENCHFEGSNVHLYSNAAPTYCNIIFNSRFDGGRVDLPNNSLTVLSDCTLNNCRVAAATAGSGFRVANCSIVDIQTGIAVDVGGSDYLVSNNVITMNAAAAAFPAVRMAGIGIVESNNISTYNIAGHLNGNDMTFRHNTITLRGNAYGIRCQSGHCVVEANDIVVASGNTTTQSVIIVEGGAAGAAIRFNYIDGTGQQPAGAKRAIDVQQNAHNTQVVCNQILNTTNNFSFQQSIYVRGLYCKITDNLIADVGRNGAYAIYLDNEYEQCFNNQIRLIDGTGIYIEYGYCQVGGNNIYGNSAGVDGGIIVNGVETGLQVNENYIYGTLATPALTFNAASTYCMVEGNVYRGTVAMPGGAGCVVANNMSLP